MYSLVLSELHPVHSDSTSVKWEPVVLQRWNEGHLKKEEHKNVVNCLKKKKKKDYSTAKSYYWHFNYEKGTSPQIKAVTF